MNDEQESFLYNNSKMYGYTLDVMTSQNRAQNHMPPCWRCI